MTVTTENDPIEQLIDEACNKIYHTYFDPNCCKPMTEVARPILRALALAVEQYTIKKAGMKNG